MRANREPLVFALTLAGAAALMFSIAVGEILLGTALVTWLVWNPRRPTLPSYFIPLCAFVLTTALSLAFSPDPEVNWFFRKTILFGMLFLGATFVNTPWRARTSIAVLLGAAALTSVLGIGQFAIKYIRFLSTPQADDPIVLARITGFMGHWMTYSGEQMLVWCASVPALLSLGRRWYAALFAVGTALILSFTRSAWLGAAAGFAAVSLLLPRQVILKTVVPMLIIALPFSGLIYHRFAVSAETPNFGPDVARVELRKAGLQMIREHPLLGVGPEQIAKEFRRLHAGERPPNYFYGHLHNTFLQIAAERGLPCFATFLWFLFELYAGLFRIAKNPDAERKWIAISALAALSGFVVSGLFEYNFGDSEVLLLLLFIVSAPFGVIHDNRGNADSLGESLGPAHS